MKSVTKVKSWFYWAGILIVVASHVYMLVYGLAENQITGHAIANLVAAGLIGYAWFKRN